MDTSTRHTSARVKYRKLGIGPMINRANRIPSRPRSRLDHLAGRLSVPGLGRFHVGRIALGAVDNVIKTFNFYNGGTIILWLIVFKCVAGGSIALLL